jgi:CxxC motif-containing protein (DUF1111 family)
MQHTTSILSLCAVLLLAGGCTHDSEDVISGGTMQPPIEPPNPVADKALLGGDTTVFINSSAAYESPAANLAGDSLALHLAGDIAFEDVFVTAPAPVNSGLGPIFNNSSCIRCHPRDGRGKAAEPGVAQDSIFLRISVGNDPLEGPLAPQGFGTQLQHRAVFGVAPEASVEVNYITSSINFADGEVLELRQPIFAIVDAYDTLADDVLHGARMAPPVFGRGLLEAIPEATLLEWADEFDADNDGISGRPNRVRDPVSGETRIGRFGLKANAPSLLVQNAGAYHQDMGITSSIFPVESAYAQIQDDGLQDDPEVDDKTLDAVTFYVQTLGVPARRNVDGVQETRGEELFVDANCVACHKMETRTGAFPDIPELAEQVIYPFTDLLLHDMGAGLADGRPDFLADGNEWRTPPLWGIGLTETVNGHTNFLHDGRARTLMEAIMWHGGEAEASRETVRNMPKADRDALLAFLQSI